MGLLVPRERNKTMTVPPSLVPEGYLAFAPAVAVNRAGMVGVTYYREAKPEGKTLAADYWFRSSSDGGKSFGREQLMDGPFGLQKAPRMKEGYFVGDYDRLAAAGQSFVACFAVPNVGSKHDRTAVAVTTIEGRGSTAY